MLFKIKKAFSFLLASVLFALSLSFNMSAFAIRCDSIFSVGPACRPAQWLRKTHKRFQSCPLDWMMQYSLDTAMHFFRNKFSDFFEDVRATGEIIGSNRVVRDNRNGIVSMHHFNKNVSLESAKWDFRGKMLRRAREVDRILKNSRSIILICNRQKDSFDDFKRFLHNFSRLYPDRDIALINIRNNGGNFTRDVLYETFAATTRKKKPKKKIKTKRRELKNKETATDAQNMEQNTNLDKKKLKKQAPKHRKKEIKKRRRKLRIIQYSFNDSSSNWEGNPYGWQRVMDEIELTGRNFSSNMDFKNVEF